MSDAPDIVLCSKLCRHNPADPKTDCRHRKCYLFKNYVALLSCFRDYHFDGSVSSNVCYVMWSHGTDCHAESLAGRVQWFKVAKIYPVSPFSVGCLWHSHGKNPVRLYPKLQSQPIGLSKIFIDYLFFKADQSDCTKSALIFNRFATSEERSLPNLSRLKFPTRGLGWLVHQRNPSGYWQMTKGDLSQIISFLHDSFLFRSSFFIRF